MSIVQERAIDRRKQLVAAAAELTHRNGFVGTRLADVAIRAGVPAGGIYYYFRTREDLLKAILQEHTDRLRDRMERWDRLPDPTSRLHALIQVWIDDKELDALYGCRVGSLCYELSKRGGKWKKAASEPLQVTRDWCKRQFAELGKGEQAQHLADHLVVVLQGAVLVGNAFDDPELIGHEAHRLKEWVSSFA